MIKDNISEQTAAEMMAIDKSLRGNTTAALTAVALADEKLVELRRTHAEEIAKLKLTSERQSIAFDKLNMKYQHAENNLTVATRQIADMDHALKKMRKAVRIILK